MLTNEQLNEYILKATNYMKDTEAQSSQIGVYLKELSNIFHAHLSIKENGVYGLLEAATIQFQITLQQLPMDVKPDMKLKLHDLLVKFATALDTIAGNVAELDNANLEIYKAISNMFLYIEKLFRLKDVINMYPQPRGFPPM